MSQKYYCSDCNQPVDQPCCKVEVSKLKKGVKPVGCLLVIGEKANWKNIKKLKSNNSIKLPCLECGKLHEFDIDSNEANRVFNVFCPDKDCEDKYAFKQ